MNPYQAYEGNTNQRLWSFKELPLRTPRSYQYCFWEFGDINELFIYTESIYGALYMGA